MNRTVLFNMKLNFLITIILLLSLSNTYAQSWEDNLKSLIINSNQFRSKILTKDTSEMKLLGEKIELWKNIISNEEVFEDIIFHSKYSSSFGRKFKKKQAIITSKT